MSVGLLAVVDDILAAALKASAKSAAVVIDDAAVTPQYVQGISPARELPVVLRIALGSIVNKFAIIIPLALVLTAFAPWVLPWLLIVGGLYLCYEGAEKVIEWTDQSHRTSHAVGEPKNEKSLVFGAVRTDLILSTSHVVQTRFASRVDPPFSGKKASGSVCEHSASVCHASGLSSSCGLRTPGTPSFTGSTNQSPGTLERYSAVISPSSKSL